MNAFGVHFFSYLCLTDANKPKNKTLQNKARCKTFLKTYLQPKHLLNA